MKTRPDPALDMDDPRERSRRIHLRGLLEFEGKMRWEGDLDDLRQRNKGPLKVRPERARETRPLKTSLQS
jgi:hypothetical protein